MNKFKKKVIQTAIAGLVGSAAFPGYVMAWGFTGSTSGSSSYGAKVIMSDSSGVVRSGKSFTLKAGQNASATHVEWSLYLIRPGNVKEIKSKLKLPISDTFELSDKITEWGMRYSVVPEYFKDGKSVYVGDAISLTAVESPIISKSQLSKDVVNKDLTKFVVSHVELGALAQEPESVSITMSKSEDGIGGVTVIAIRISKGVYEAVFDVPKASGIYPVTVDVKQAFGVVTKFKRTAALSVIAPPKVVVAYKPKLIDATENMNGDIARLKISSMVPESVLPSSVAVGKIQQSLYYAEWKINGVESTGIRADEPKSIKLTPAQYQILLSAAKAKAEAAAAAGKSSKPVVTIPVSVKVFHPNHRAETETSLSFEIPVGEPWIMPKWSLVPRTTDRVVAPGNVTLKATPSVEYDTAVARRHNLTWEWDIPGVGIKSRVSGRTLSVEVNQPGNYPILLTAKDDLGKVEQTQYILKADAPTLTVSNLETNVSPISARNPVTVKLKVGTTSTHKRERVTGYTVKLDGNTLYSDKNLKPFAITTAGNHYVTVVAASNMGSSAEKTVQVNVALNQKPTCNPFKLSFQKNQLGVVTSLTTSADCRDEDGKVKEYAWSFNEQAAGAAIPRASYLFNKCENSVAVKLTVTDDSGDSRTYRETVNRGGVSDCL